MATPIIAKGTVSQMRSGCRMALKSMTTVTTMAMKQRGSVLAMPFCAFVLSPYSPFQTSE